MPTVNSKDIDPIYYDDDFHARVVKEYETMLEIAEAEGDKKWIDDINSDRVFDENGYFVGLTADMIKVDDVYPPTLTKLNDEDEDDN